ncbi:MAG: hypothetical protein ACC645_09475 [Pirellulales bacterium]
MFLLISTIAVVTAMVQSGKRNVIFAHRDVSIDVPDALRRVDPDKVAGSTIALGFAGMVTGAILGLRVEGGVLFRLRGLVVGGLIGLMLGGAAGFLIFCPPSLSVVLGGSLLIVATGLIGRRAAR